METAFGLAVIMAAATLLVAAQSPSPAPAGGGGGEVVAGAPGPSSVDCFTYLANVTDCLSFVEAGSNLTKPEKPCCPEMAGLVESQPICLCELLSNSSGNFGIEVDVHKALTLPSICAINAPSASLCSVIGYPVAGVPMSSEEPSSPDSSMAMPMPPGAPSSSQTGKSAATAIQISHPSFFLIICLAIALFSS